MNSKDNQEFYTAEELAKILKVNIMTIYRYIKAGKITAYKIGKEFRIEKEEFNIFLNKVKTKQ
jgi:putative molybdopterin biosynthesis protein